MNNEYWHEEDLLDEENKAVRSDKKVQAKVRKRKWREIESIKDQRRLRRDLSDFEQYSY